MELSHLLRTLSIDDQFKPMAIGITEIDGLKNTMVSRANHIKPF